MKTPSEKFWKIVKANWTTGERSDLRAAVEAWMAARVDQ